MDLNTQLKLDKFFSQFKLQSYPKASLLIEPDKQLEEAFCLKKGIVRCYALSKDGAELTINIFKPVSFFPMGWVLINRRDRYFYEALTEVEVIAVPKEKFKQFVEDNHEVTLDLLKRIYRGLEGYLLRMESLLAGDAYLRTITNILIHTLRFGDIKDNEPVKLQLTHTQIAAQSGLSRETVTREIKKLQEKGIVSYKGETMLIHSPHKLEQEVLE